MLNAFLLLRRSDFWNHFGRNALKLECFVFSLRANVCLPRFLLPDIHWSKYFNILNNSSTTYKSHNLTLVYCALSDLYTWIRFNLNFCCFYFFIHMYVWSLTCHRVYVEIKEQFSGVSSVLLPCGFQGSSASSQVGQLSSAPVSDISSCPASILALAP